jgi:hypothetical protein
MKVIFIDEKGKEKESESFVLFMKTGNGMAEVVSNMNAGDICYIAKKIEVICNEEMQPPKKRKIKKVI